jgi:hypothetical protein
MVFTTTVVVNAIRVSAPEPAATQKPGVTKSLLPIQRALNRLLPLRVAPLALALVDLRLPVPVLDQLEQLVLVRPDPTATYLGAAGPASGFVK